MELSSTAFTEDGFLIRQTETERLSCGGMTSARNGCGWIAAYNFLRADLHPVKWQQVYRDLNRLFLFGGKQGLNAFVLRGYLRSFGCRLHSACTMAGARVLVKDCRAGLVLYATGNGTQRHYVAFQRLSDGRLRFFNVRPDVPEITLTTEEFYRAFVRFPVFFLFVTR